MAINGTDAVEKTIELKPDVILVDISMPHLNGLKSRKVSIIRFRAAGF